MAIPLRVQVQHLLDGLPESRLQAVSVDNADQSGVLTYLVGAGLRLARR